MSSREQKLKTLVESGLYVVTDTNLAGNRPLEEIVAAAIAGGVRVVQFREKTRSKREILPLARRLRYICAEGGALFIVNDHIDLTLLTEADGVHLGQDDLPIPEARKLLPSDIIVGSSTHSVAEARRAVAEGADYVVLGSIFPTQSKPGAVPVGTGLLREVRSVVPGPLVAIGGINLANVAEVIAAGADAVAVISAVIAAADPRAAAADIIGKIKSAKT